MMIRRSYFLTIVSRSLYDGRMRRRGPLSERVTIPMKAELLQAVDEWRRRQPDIPNRAEAIRRLLEQALGLSSDDEEPRW